MYSAHWPVIDGEERVTPSRAMREAARVVAESEVTRLYEGRANVTELDAETRLAVVALGINGLGAFAFDDALQLSKSLNLALHNRSGNHRAADDGVAYPNERDDARARRAAGQAGQHNAPA